MYKLNNIKRNVLILSFSTLLSGCGGGGTSTLTDSTTPTSIDSTIPTSTKVVHSGQVKDTATGQGLADVEVSIGSHTVTTNKEGVYTLSNLTEDEETVVNFKKEGYLLGSTHIQLKSLSGDNSTSHNYLEYGLHAHDKEWNYDSSEEISNTNIVIDASVDYIDTEGNPYSGSITADLTILDTTTDEGKAIFPGTFMGMNTNGMMVQFDSYGMISISLQDGNGNTLRLADGESATLKFDTTSLKGESIIPLWYYNYKQGLWIEEGYAELQDDGTYEGEISHPGTWSLNQPIENAPGIYRGRILYEDGTPAQDIRIHAVGNNWMSSDLSTNENGIFEIEVIPGRDFQLKAYDYSNKYSAQYSGLISAIASGDIVEDRI